MSNEPDGGTARVMAAERLLRLRAGPEGGYASLQSELLHEKALSYSRAVARVDTAYAALAEAERALDAALPDARAAHLSRCEEAHDQTVYYRWELLVQREAIGMTDGEEFERSWPAPKRRR